jgi:regulatory protein
MSNAYQAAVRLLARREHSLAELEDKLMQKGYEASATTEALTLLQQQGLQSDARFAESVCRTRMRQGYGPLRIRQELQSKHVAAEFIDDVLQAQQNAWFSLATQVHLKKYADQSAVSFAEKQKQRQFLRYRGFSMEIISAVVE